jgi:hypothetical protein
MALLGDRLIIQDSIDYFSSGLAEKGQVVVFAQDPSGGAGVSLDDAEAFCYVASTASGTIPLGVIIQDVVNKDLTQTHLNFYKEEVQTGGKVTIVQKGWVVTNKITGNPKAGDKAYLTNNGNVTPTFVNATATPQVGVFGSRKNSDGFAKLYVELPK